MISLILAIAASTLVAVFMRIGEGRIRNNMGMFAVNYIVAILLSWAYIGQIELLPDAPGLGISVGLGAAAGFLYLANFVLLQVNIRKNGMMLSSTFMKLGVLIPTIMAVLVFHEEPKATQLAGILLAVLAIVLINFEKEQSTAGRYRYLLIVLLLCGGFTDSLANVFDKVGNSELKDQYLFCTFLSAFLCSAVMCFREHKKIGLWDVSFGVLIGVPNYYSSRFLLASLQNVPAVIVYPVYSIGTIVAVSAAGILFFRERPDRRKAAALFIIFAALALLNI